VDAAADRAGLRGVMHQPIETLSKGYKRRVGLAAALVHDPKVLVLDEPTDGLDPNQKHEVRRLISGLGADKTVILSTHILEEVDAVCTRAVIIARGKVVADETPAALRSRAASGRLDDVFRALTAPPKEAA
jgi:ABC-2 type transport system ATP-binding protein